MNIFTNFTITPSATVAINSLALQKKQAGERVYNLSAGEPMIDTAENIKQAAINAIRENKTHYPPVAGLPELREEATIWLNYNYGGNYQPENVLVSTGGKMGLYLLLQALIAPGDEVLIVSPYWVSYPSMVELFGGMPKIVEGKEKNNWRVELEDLKKNCFAKTKILILNNGSNPTGVLYSRKEIETILEFAVEKNLFVISDEVYSGLVYDNNQFISCASFPKFRNNLAVIQSCSKNFAMTGWRVGFVFGEKNLIQVLTSLTSQSTSGVATVSQLAAVAALQNSKIIMPQIQAEMQKRRDVFCDAFAENFGVALTKPPSGLYCFIPLATFGTKVSDSVQFCQNMLSEANVAMIPGASFGHEGFVRCSFGERPEELELALKHLADYLKK